MGTASTSILIISVIVVAILVFVVIMQYIDANRMNNTVLTRGFSGNVQDSVQLSCPAGRTINMQNAVVMCSTPNEVMDANTDPMLANGFFNSNNVLDVIGESYITPANGVSSYTIKLPDGWTMPNSCANGDTPVIVGTYDCVPSGTASTKVSASTMIGSGTC